MTLQGKWVKFRKAIPKYQKTEQQKKVKVAGELIRRVCKGKKGETFIECRREVLQCAFHDEKCQAHLREAKREVLEKD